MEEEQALGTQTTIARQRLADLGRLIRTTTDAAVRDAATHLGTAARARAKPDRHPSERFVNVYGGTRQEAEHFIAWAASIGITLRLAPGPLLRSTRAGKRKGERVFTHMPLSATAAGSSAAGIFRAAAARLYVQAGLSPHEATQRARREAWTSHGGRRGATTEILNRLGRYKALNPDGLTADIEHLVNIHFGWADPDLTSQAHYTGMRDLASLLLITSLL
jgi:hypothetical protein